MHVRKGTAEWKGSLAEGTGTLATESGAVSGTYSVPSRFETAQGTNPEELVGAALAGCFSMALSGALTRAGHVPESIRTEARVHIEKGEVGWTITRIDLVTAARVPGVAPELFQEKAAETKKGCPVSRALSAVPIHVEARLD
jgi:osmotically inducible protein OsmC